MTPLHSEIHLFLIWENGRGQAGRIVADIQEHFDVLDVLEIEWSRSRFARNLTRFYGQSLPPGSDKERHCGTGPLLLIVVRDREPEYGARTMWGTARYVNVRMFDAKQRYRDWNGGGHRVHSTIEAKETDHNLFFILGERAPCIEMNRKGRGAASSAASCATRWLGRPAHAGGAADGGRADARLRPPARASGLAWRLRLLVEGAWVHWGVEWLVAEPDEQPAGARGPFYVITVGALQRDLELRHVGDGYLEPVGTVRRCAIASVMERGPSCSQQSTSFSCSCTICSSRAVPRAPPTWSACAFSPEVLKRLRSISRIPRLSGRCSIPS